MPKELNLDDILKEIKKAWQETIEHFGDKFPFKKELKYKIKGVIKENG